MEWEVVNIEKRTGIVKDPHFNIIGNRVEFSKVCSDYIKKNGFIYCSLLRFDNSFKFVFSNDGKILLNFMKHNNKDVCIYSKELCNYLKELCVNTCCIFVTIKDNEFIF